MGAVACLAACSDGPVQIDAPELTGAQAEACESLIAALPDTVGGQVQVESDGDFGAAFGDPPIVVTCGVGRPDHLMTNCTAVDGVDWYLDESDERYIATTVGREPNVEIVVPAEYQESASTQIDLAEPIKKHTAPGQGC